jgi:hypothetical protein
MHPTKHAIYSSRTADKFVVRLPDGMRERVAEVARVNHRSMNSEIIARLQQSLGQPDQGVVEVEAPEGTVWNPSIGNLVRHDVSKRIGQITQFRLTEGEVADIEVQLDNLYWRPLDQLKPVFLKG